MNVKTIEAVISRNLLTLYFVIDTALVETDKEESVIKYIVSQKIWNVLLECSIIHTTLTCPNLCQYSDCGNLSNALCVCVCFCIFYVSTIVVFL